MLTRSEDTLQGPTHDNIQCWGLMLKSRRRLYYFAHVCALLFVISQYIELWILRKDLELAMRNLSVTMLSTVCVFKANTFIFWEKSWFKLFENVTELEKIQLLGTDSMTKMIIAEYSRRSRKVTRFYKFLITVTVSLVILAPMLNYLSSFEYRNMIKNGSIPYPEIISSWVPFDKTRGFGYWVTILEQSIICCYGGSVVANFDCNAIVLMSFFTGQLKILSKNCARLFDGIGDLPYYDEAVKRIKECHFHHLYIVKFSSVLNSLLSPVMFLYVIICSLMVCASAIQLTTEDTGNMQRLRIAEYLVALIAQLFLYCWHCNEVFDMSKNVYSGVHKSVWYKQNVRVRRSLLLLGGQLRKTIVFTAGPFTKLNIATFVAILKGSYSYYTLLDKKDG